MDAQPGVLIRLAVVAEAEFIASILLQAFTEYRSHYTPGGFAATTPTADQLKARWDEGPVWVALVQAEIVGTVGAVPKERGMYVRSMAILPAARGHKIGQSLLQYVEQFAREQHSPLLYLSTTPFLDRAIRLYEKFGFQRMDDGPTELHGTPLFTMMKPLH